ncbi:MAG: hypothetical protein NZ480_05690 [Bdellovibrionaceae bacterium]|nr:hypothetical protein [Pseudobdellovibrionaceae bacterium]MDW8189382.1 flagellar motor protein MotB [Pseudobdellovibrionaceae bacterium]
MNSIRPKSSHSEEPVTHERWLISYADFITLLFAFFVVMYATSEANLEKQKKFQESLAQSFKLSLASGHHQGGSDSSPSSSSDRSLEKKAPPISGNAPLGIGLPHHISKVDAEMEDIALSFLNSSQLPPIIKKIFKVQRNPDGNLIISVPYQYVTDRSPQSSAILSILAHLLRKLDHPAVLSLTPWSHDLNDYFRTLLELRSQIIKNWGAYQAPLGIIYLADEASSSSTLMVNVQIKR